MATFYGNLSTYYATAFMERWAACDDNEERSEMLEHLTCPGAIQDWVEEMLLLESISPNLAAAIIESIDFDALLKTIMEDESTNWDCPCFNCGVPGINFDELYNANKCTLLCGVCDKKD